MDEYDARLRKEEHDLWIGIAISAIAILAVGILAGVYIHFGVITLVAFVAIAVAYTGSYADDSTPVMIIVCTVLTWLVALIAWYFATGQHWVGDFIKEYVLR